MAFGDRGLSGPHDTGRRQKTRLLCSTPGPVLDPQLCDPALIVYTSGTTGQLQR